MTFNEWFDEEGGYDGGFDTYQSAAEAAWDYQQQRIDELEEKLDSLEVTLDTVEAALGQRYRSKSDE